MQTLDFLQTLYNIAASGYLTIWTMPDKKMAYFPVTDLPKAVKYAESRFDTHDVYYGVGLRWERLGKHQRGGNDDVSVIPALWTDIDILGAAHKETALPPTADAALEFLDNLPLKPSIVVSSGNGLHVYWLFDKPLGIATEAHRANIAGALRGWQTYINDAARERGWKLDNTSDLSRVLRVPGSVNHKNGGNAEVTVIHENNERYSPLDFSAYIIKANEGKPNQNSDFRLPNLTWAAGNVYSKSVRSCGIAAITPPLCRSRIGMRCLGIYRSARTDVSFVMRSVEPIPTTKPPRPTLKSNTRKRHGSRILAHISVNRWASIAGIAKQAASRLWYWQLLRKPRKSVIY